MNANNNLKQMMACIKNRFLICLALFGLILMLSDCSRQKNSGKQVFSYNEPTGIATLDPAFAKNQSIMWPIHQLYNTLVEIDTGLQIIPSLARSWEISADRLRYTFHIRKHIFFQDNEAFLNGKGRELTASDIVYSLSRIRDKAVASSGAWIFNNRVDTVEGFTALNDSTFQLKLIRPFHPILGILSMQYCSIVPKEVVEKYGKDFRRHPCGTGPFQFGSWEEGENLVLIKNKNYWEKDEKGLSLPYLDAIKISFFEIYIRRYLF